MAVRAAGRAGSSRGPLVHRAHGGFSLVELLVTIVLAGIIFAAMVPLFVSAAKASSGDRARNIATTVAQSRIESLRLLSFSQLTDPSIMTNLDSSSYQGGQFGSTYSPPGGGGAYAIQYSLTNVPSTGAVNYVRATVSVTTPATPGPAYTTTMSTIVLNPSAISNSSSPTPHAVAVGLTLGLTFTIALSLGRQLHADRDGQRRQLGQSDDRRDRGEERRHAKRDGDTHAPVPDDDDQRRLERPTCRPVPRYLPLLQEWQDERPWAHDEDADRHHYHRQSVDLVRPHAVGGGARWDGEQHGWQSTARAKRASRSSSCSSR